MKTNTHWKRFDDRINILKLTISGLENSLAELKNKTEEFAWYDGLFLLEESEPICGLAFIAIQNYINSSIYDRFKGLEKQYLMYKKGTIIKYTGRTDIELIISLANYYKHRDQPRNVKDETSKILNDFNLKFDKDVDIENSPIFKGLGMFSENWDLDTVVKAAESWREKLWLIEE